MGCILNYHNRDYLRVGNPIKDKYAICINKSSKKELGGRLCTIQKN